MMSKKKIGWKILGCVIFIPGLLLLATWVFMLLWNALMTKIFGLPEIMFWQSLGLIVLAKFLFGNIWGKNKWKEEKKCHCGDKADEHPENHEKSEQPEQP